MAPTPQAATEPARELEQLRAEVHALTDSVRYLAGSIPLSLLTVGQAAGINRVVLALLDLRKEF